MEVPFRCNMASVCSEYESTIFTAAPMLEKSPIFVHCTTRLNEARALIFRVHFENFNNLAQHSSSTMIAVRMQTWLEFLQSKK